MDPVWSEAETEILVHTSAPSHALDDTYYRALASAYIDFHPAQTTHLVPSGHGRSSTDRRGSAGTAQSPQLSFEDVWDNVGSPLPVLQPWLREEPLAADSQLSLAVPPSEVDDSKRSHPTHLGIQSWQLSEPPTHENTLLPPSSPDDLRDTGASTAVAHAGSVDSGGDDEDHGYDWASSSSRADSEPPSAKRRKRSPQPLELMMMTKSLSDLGPRTPMRRHDSRAVRKAGMAPRLADALEVFAPEPDGSCDYLEPSSLLTDNLIKLDSDLGLKRRFLSKRQLLLGREPRPTERGFWELACASWDTGFKANVWGYLAQYIGDGRAGWGVWLKRDAETNSIRLFSFGHVLGHMYLLLYTATRRRILSLGCVWISGGDSLVFVPATKDGWGE